MSFKSNLSPKLKPWIWFLGLYLASVSVVALLEFGSRYVLSFT